MTIGQSTIPTVLFSANSRLMDSLSQTHASPFIAHHELDDELARKTREATKIFICGDSARLNPLLEKFPAVGTWIIASVLTKHYGEEGNRKIYFHIAKAFGIADGIPQQCHRPLLKAFRHACQYLSLTLPHRTVRLVDNYLLQAGVAQNQLSAMVDAFLDAETTLGSPPAEDTRQLNAWEDAAADLAPLGLRVLRHILWHDQSAYHALAFSRLRNNEPPVSSFEESLREFIKQGMDQPGWRDRVVAVSPSLIFLDGELALSLPRGTKVVELAIAGLRRRLAPGGVLTLKPPWPDTINWRVSGSDGVGWVSQAVFGSERCVLVFDGENGRLLKAFTDEDRDKPAIVDAEEVAILSPAPFTADGEVSHSIAQNVYVLYRALNSEQSIICKDQNFIMLPSDRPRIRLDAPLIANGPDGPLYGAPLHLSLHFFSSIPESGLEVDIEHPSLTAVQTIIVTAEGGPCINLSTILPDIGPFGALRVKVRAAGVKRVLVRARFWLWPGLRALREGKVFEATAIPENFDADSSRFITTNDRDELALDMDQPYRKATLVFRRGEGVDDHVRTTFDLNRPGVSVAVVSEDGHERFIEEGGTITIRSQSADRIVIRTSDPTDGLEILGKRETPGFTRQTGRRSLWLVALSGRVGADEVIAVAPGGRWEYRRPLVYLRSISTPETFALEVRADHVHCRFQMNYPIDGVRIVIRDCFGGTSSTGSVALMGRPVEERENGLITAELIDAECREVFLRLFEGGLPQGVNLAEISVRPRDGEVWQQLTDASGRSHVIPMPSATVPDELLVHVDPYDAFCRLTDALNRCISADCYDAYVNVLEPVWRSVGLILKDRPHGKRLLLNASLRSLPDDAPPSWIPRHHPIELEPNLYGAPSEDFSELAGIDSVESGQLAYLAIVGRLSNIREAAVRLPTSGFFFPGFGNFNEVKNDTAIALRDFSFENYQLALKYEPEGERDFWRLGREILSIAHHNWCLSRAADRLERIHSEDTYQTMWRWPNLEWVGAKDFIPTPEQLLNRFEILRDLPRFISGLARLSRLNDATKFQGVGGIVQTIRLAPELFAFYLILWELVRRTE